MSGQRIFSIDTMRVPAILAVICLHSLPFQGKAFGDELSRWLAVTVNQLARFAVPFFFIASGYFFGASIRGGAQPGPLLRRYAQRLLVLFVIWSIFYLLVPLNLVQIEQYGLLRNAYWKLAVMWHNPVNFLFEGFSDHLWFLTALVCGLAMVAVFAGRRLWPLVVLAAAFYALHVLSNSYRTTAMGFTLPFNARNGPGVSTMFVLIGYAMASGRFKVSAGIALLIALIGTAMHLGESLMLQRFFDMPCDGNDFLVGTIPMAAGLMLFCLAKPDWCKQHVAPLGAFTLGIYVVHPVFIRLLRPVGNAIGQYWWEILFPLLVWGLSLAVVALMMRNKLLRKSVT